MPLKQLPAFLCVLCVLCGEFSFSTRVSADDKPVPTKPTARQEKQIEGWTVLVDERLFEKENEKTCRRALQLLEAELADIASVVQPDRLEKLQQVKIVLDLTHGKLGIMQYHPSADWLVSNGYAKELEKCVHIPSAAGFISPRMHHEQPWCVLHELSHAYHDQVLGFDDPRVRAVYDKYKASGHGDSVLHINRRHTKHYALTNHKEFFAEMSEAYFGMNDFFPFNQAELKEAEPEVFELMKTVWTAKP